MMPTMIVILNGSVGVGKTTVAFALNESFDKSVMIDGDYLGAVHPGELYDTARISYLYKTIAHLVGFHRAHGYPNVVINYVFESPGSLAELVDGLRPHDSDIHTFWLVCAEAEQRERILRRRTGIWEWELERFLELNAIQEAVSRHGDIGARVDTTGKSVAEVVTAIRKVLFQR